MTMKYDLLTGLFMGVTLGLVFSAQLAPHLPFIVILTILLIAKVAVK
jgi:hypothetical protein